MQHPHNESSERAASIIAPPPRLLPSEWAGQFAYVPNEGNSEPGRYRLSRMPHQEAMLDDPIGLGVREVVWMLASQAGGKTMCLNLLCEYAIHQLKKSIIMARSTKETALEWMRDKFLPSVAATPCMEGLLVEPRKRGSNSTSLNRKFPGGGIKVIGAKSPSAFRGASAGILMGDEVDSWTTIKEGDPLALLYRAAITFPKAWKIIASTPTLDGFSRINTGYLKGDQQKYFLPCPCCGAFQWLKTEQLKFSFTADELPLLDLPDYHPNKFVWEIGEFAIKDTRRALYVCEHCHHGWTDSQRIECYMSGHPDNAPVVVNGAALRAHWRALAPFKGIRSRQLSGMYLTIGLKPGFDSYLHQFAEDFLEAVRGGRETLMVWTNIFKCEPFEEASEKVDWKAIRDRVEEYGPELPEPAVLVSFACDIQKDRVEVMWIAHGDQEEAWLLERHAIYGDFDMPDCQQAVEDYLFSKSFKHPVLGEIKFSIGALDSGHQTKVKAVYQFCGKHRLNNIWSVKGFGESALNELYQCKKERTYGGLRANLNVDVFKTQIFERLRKTEPGPRCIHFPKNESFDDAFFKQVCSERRFPERQKNGGYIFRWKKLTSSTRNEGLDLLVYNFGILAASKLRHQIAQKWKEIQAKKPSSEPVVKKDYQLKPFEDKKPEPAPAQKNPFPVKRFQRPVRVPRMAGMFNPLGL